MIKDDCKSGASVPETFKLARTNTPSSPSHHVIDPANRVVVIDKKQKPLTGAFPYLEFHFANQGVQLHRTDWRDGPVTYFAIKNQRAQHISTLSELAMALWAWEKTHG